MTGQMIEIRWHARGGQGAKTAAIFLAEAVLDKGKYGQGFPEYGPERRGAPVRGYTRIADEPIRQHCTIEKPNLVIVLDPTLIGAPAAAVTAGTSAETTFLVNSTESAEFIAARLKVPGAKVYKVDATKIALESFKRDIPNMPMIGALLAVVDLMTIDELKASMSLKFAHKFSQAVVDGNLVAVQRAYDEAASSSCFQYEGQAAELAVSSLLPASKLVEAGLIVAPGNASEYETGDWRTFVPKFVLDNCIHCLFCWIWCPDSAIELDLSGEKPQMVGINLKHCKGCGICAKECPPARKGKDKSALIMELEEK
ncbi:MAG: 2-oxoacid:acceptor oxidoreductase family protein [bacterium]